MPIYEYQCAKCGHRFERMQKFSDPPPKKCPQCRGRVEQLMSAPAVQFKGSGWYATDYARKSAPSAESGDGPPPKKTEEKETAAPEKESKKEKGKRKK